MKTSWPSRIRASERNQSFVAFLRSHYESRRARNPKYSLRAFAKYLGLDHSTLSQIMRGKRSLTSTAIARIGARLGLNDELIAAYQARGGGRKLSREELEVQQLTLDAYEVISEWHHFALLELTHLEGFKADARWIARTLGITTDQVNIAITRLARLGLLRMQEKGKWEDRSRNASMHHEQLTDVALGRVHRESHELAIRAIEQVPPELRDHASITLALSTSQLPKLAGLIAGFRRELLALADDTGAKDDVYRVDVSVFPLTTLHQKRTNNQQENPHA